MNMVLLQDEMINALKAGEKKRKVVISGLIDEIKKAAINKNCRDNITDELVNEVLLKCKKTYQEMVDTCPKDREQLLEDYKQQLAIVNEFAPKLLTDEREIGMLIAAYAREGELSLTKNNRGKIMKLVSAKLKGKADMKIVNKVVGGMLS